jgi:hypothetical protein
MPTYTPKFLLPKPLGTDNFTRANFNALIDQIEANINTETINKIAPLLVTDLPSAYPVGLSFFELSEVQADAWETAIGHTGTFQRAIVQTVKATGTYNINQRITLSSASAAPTTYERSSNANNSWHQSWKKVVSRDEFTAFQEEVDAHLAEDAIDAHNASNISVADANNRFTGTNVETVLDELFQFANNGKTDIASVIGSPATSGDTFATLKTHIQNNKNTLATNLTNKGQSSAGTETLSSLVGKVANISTLPSDILYFKGSNANLWEQGINIGSASFSKQSDHMLLQLPGGSSQISCVTSSMYDLTNFKGIAVLWEQSDANASSYLIASTSKTGSAGTFNAQQTVAGVQYKGVLLDVSSLSGNFYIRMHTSSTAAGTLKIRKVILL